MRINSSIILLVSILLVSILFFFLANDIHGQATRKEKRKDFDKTVRISGGFVFSKIQTSIFFTGPDNLLTLRLGLENNLGLTESKTFYSGSVLTRLTPRSGLFGSYYRIHRRKIYTLQNDLPYLEEIIPDGTQIDVYFNTNVFNVGYVLTFFSDKKSFLGGYFNVYLMNIKTGVSSQGVELNENLHFLAPLPSFGLVADFIIAPWFGLRGNVSLFYLCLNEYQEKVNDASLMADFRLAKWLYVYGGYKLFGVYVSKEVNGFEAAVEYDTNGPSVGVMLKF